MSRFSLHTLYPHNASNVLLRPLHLRNGSHFWSAETTRVELVPPEVGISCYRDISVHTGIEPHQTQFIPLPNRHQSVPIQILYRIGTWLSVAWSR